VRLNCPRNAQARHLGEPRLGIGEQLALVRGDRVEPICDDVVERRAEPDDRRDVGRTGFEGSSGSGERRA
jgi:hypothetical protein